MQTDEVRLLLGRHQDALNRHDVGALKSFYADDAVVDSPMFDTVRGRDAIGASFERLFALFPDYRVRVSDDLFLADGDRAAEFSTVTGTHTVEFFGLPPTGQQIEYHVARLFTLRDLTITYEQRIYDFGAVIERMEKARLNRELTTASVVQHALCSTKRVGRFYEAVGTSLPCRAIGGDFLEFLDLDAGALGLAVGDVSGKGPAAALVAAMLQGMFSIVAAEAAGPSAALSRLNRALVRRHIEPRFATVSYATLTPQGTLSYANAGHNPPLLLTRTGVGRLTAGGPMLGVFSDADFPGETVHLAPGDAVIAFSDGVTDATNLDGVEFGIERLLDAAMAHRLEPPAALLDHLASLVREFCGDSPASDDVTIAVVRYGA